MENMYGLNHSIKSFAVSNDFVVNTNKACYALGQQLSPFCFYANDKQKEFGVIDFTSFNGMIDESKSLVSEIADYRKEVFKNVGISVDTSDKLKQRLLLFDYFLTISICYVEVPKYMTKNGVATPTFDKFLATRNPALMAVWMGSNQPSEFQAKYSAKIQSRQVEFNDNSIRFVKLNHTKKGNTITLPRSDYNVENMTCYPMYMLYAFIEGFKPLIQNGIVKFSYLKDNGTIRELNTTISESIIRDYYNDNVFINSMLSGIDINSVQQGGMILSSKMNRGYIKVPELGASIYDASGVRSLNIARLLKAEVVDSVDKTFINVDLNSVVQNFNDCCDYLVKTDAQKLYDMYKELSGEEFEEDKISSPVVCNTACQAYVEKRSTWFSTSYHRDLHVFMISHPDWFPLYTGKPVAKVVSSQNIGVLPMDF